MKRRGARSRLRASALRLVGVLVTVLVAVFTTGSLAGCSIKPRPTAAIGAGRHLDVVASFYPLEFVVRELAGNRASVRNLTRPGAEAHDVELTPHDVAAVHDADLVVYLAGFQSAVDDAVDAEARGRAFDVGAVARLNLGSSEPGGVPSAVQGRRALDPHFWLDPTRLADVADAVAAQLARIDPSGAAAYAANATALRARLKRLDAEFATGLAHCRSHLLVTSHEAFAYLSARYHLQQVGIAGRSPDNEPDAATLARIADLVRSQGVTTIYYETLVSPAIARTVAQEAGVRTAVLDPLEGLVPGSQRDYLSVMRTDLAALRAGQECT